MDAVRAALKGQYHAALAMLREAVARFPDDAWEDSTHRNAPWQIAYHAVYITHVYLMPDWESFRPWAGHRRDVQYEDGIGGPVKPGDSRPLLPAPYTRDQVLAYLEFCDAFVDGAVDALDLESPESGFPWYAVPKLEHQLINLRHLQQHTGQLQDRLRTAADVGVSWVASGRPGRERTVAAPFDPRTGRGLGR